MSAVSPGVRQTVLERDLYRCVSCGTYIGPFGDYSLHHRRARGMGGTKRPETNLPANLIVLCGHATSPGGCHHWVETHREEATRKGFLVSQFRDPSTVPVQSYCGWVDLDNDGNKTEVQ